MQISGRKLGRCAPQQCRKGKQHNLGHHREALGVGDWRCEPYASAEGTDHTPPRSLRLYVLEPRLMHLRHESLVWPAQLLADFTQMGTSRFTFRPRKRTSLGPNFEVILRRTHTSGRLRLGEFDLPRARCTRFYPYWPGKNSKERGQVRSTVLLLIGGLAHDQSPRYPRRIWVSSHLYLWRVSDLLSSL